MDGWMKEQGQAQALELWEPASVVLNDLLPVGAADLALQAGLLG